MGAAQNEKYKAQMGRVTKRLFCVLSFAFCVFGCATPPPAIPHDAPLAVIEVKNLAGVPLKFPSMYFGDSLGAAEALQVEKLDLTVIARAGLYSQLLNRNHAATLELGGRWEIHAAFTELNLEKLKSKGLIKMGLLVLAVDAEAGTEIARGEAIREFRLLDVAPEDGGSLGEGRFVEGRIKAFVEALALDALTAAGIE
jgi:hypothetical protein